MNLDYLNSRIKVKRMSNTKESIHVGDIVELEYVNDKDYYINTFTGLILEIQSFTTDKERTFYKIQTSNGILDIKDKFIQSFKIIKKGE